MSVPGRATSHWTRQVLAMLRSVSGSVVLNSKSLSRSRVLNQGSAVHALIRVSLQKHGTLGQRAVCVGALAVGARLSTACLFVANCSPGAASSPRRCQAPNFAGGKSYVHLHPSQAEIEPRRNPGQKTHQQNAHENGGTGRGKTAAPIYQRQTASQE